MKKINVFAAGSGTLIAHVHGEVMLDADEGTLILHGEDPGTVITYNWRHVLGYTESPYIEGEHDAE